jgi:hypothetical protein
MSTKAHRRTAVPFGTVTYFLRPIAAAVREREAVCRLVPNRIDVNVIAMPEVIPLVADSVLPAQVATRDAEPLS